MLRRPRLVKSTFGKGQSPKRVCVGPILKKYRTVFKRNPAFKGVLYHIRVKIQTGCRGIFTHGFVVQKQGRDGVCLYICLRNLIGG